MLFVILKLKGVSMGLDIENSIKYVIQDTNWKKKCLIGAFFALGFVIFDLLNLFNNLIGDIKLEQLKPYLAQEYILPIAAIVLLLFLAGTILSIFLSGYDACNTNLRIVKPSSALLNWDNFQNLFKVGFKSIVGISVYILTLGLILILTALPALIIVLIAFKLSPILLVISCLVVLAYVIAVCFIWFLYLIAAELAFYTDLKFKSFFNFPLINRFLRKNFLEFFIFVILSFAVNTLICIINTILICTVVGIIAIPFTRFYSFLILNDLSAQFIRQSLEINPNNQ